MRESPAGGNDESPLTFVLSGYGNTKAYSGVIEFTSPPGCVTLPPRSSTLWVSHWPTRLVSHCSCAPLYLVDTTLFVAS